MPLRQTQFESLEPRLAMTGISAVLSGGVLSITATGGNDTVTLDRLPTSIKLLQTNQTFSVAAVKSVDIDLSTGDDTLILQQTGMPFGCSIGIPVTVHSGGGADVLVQPNGQQIFFGGTPETLTIGRQGSVLIDGHSPTWIDCHIPADPLGVLARQLAADKLFSRGDMLQLFDVAEQNATLGARDFASLRTIVGRDAFFAGLGYVQSLANLVVNPSVANALFEGNPLGNLSASSTSHQLTLLVDKWFLGLDHPTALDGSGDPVSYRAVDGTLFDGSPNMQQIHQGADDDCYFLSSLEAVAIHNPHVIQNMFIVNGDGTYTLRFFNNGKGVFLTVDSELPILPDGTFVFDSDNLRYDNPHNVLWSCFAEKAYAQLAELGWSRPKDDCVNSYAALDIGDAYLAIQQITGQHATDYPATTTTGAKIAKLFAENRPICFNSDDPSGDHDIVPDHVYALVGYNAQNKKFGLFNPWGFHIGTHYPALLWLTWDQITEHFAYAHVGSKLPAAQVG